MNDLEKELDRILGEYSRKTRFTALAEKPNYTRPRNEAKAKIQALIVQARINELEKLLDKDNGCICQLADVDVCDHNWSLCNTIIEEIALLKKENK